MFVANGKDLNIGFHFLPRILQLMYSSWSYSFTGLKNIAEMNDFAQRSDAPLPVAQPGTYALGAHISLPSCPLPSPASHYPSRPISSPPPLTDSLPLLFRCAPTALDAALPRLGRVRRSRWPLAAFDAAAFVSGVSPRKFVGSKKL